MGVDFDRQYSAEVSGWGWDLREEKCRGKQRWKRQGGGCSTVRLSLEGCFMGSRVWRWTDHGQLYTCVKELGFIPSSLKSGGRFGV